MKHIILYILLTIMLAVSGCTMFADEITVKGEVVTVYTADRLCTIYGYKIRTGASSTTIVSGVNDLSISVGDQVIINRKTERFKTPACADTLTLIEIMER